MTTMPSKALQIAYQLTWIDERTDQPIAFVTVDGMVSSSCTWNGWPVLLLPKWQHYMLELLMGFEPVRPSIEMDEDRSQESNYVIADGLCWEQTIMVRR